MKRKPSGPDEIDLHIGNRIRERRLLLGLAQSDVSESLGLSLRQVQKYERGANRISAGRLYQLACLLQVDIDYFFGGSAGPEGAVGNRQEDASVLPSDALSIVQAYNAIEDEDVRKGILELTKALAV